MKNAFRLTVIAYLFIQVAYMTGYKRSEDKDYIMPDLDSGYIESNQPRDTVRYLKRSKPIYKPRPPMDVDLNR